MKSSARGAGKSAPAGGAARNRSKYPLAGIRVLVGRARHQAGVLSSALRDLGAQVIEIPFIEIRKPRSFKTLDAALSRLADYDWLILTSVNGVEAMWRRLEKLNISRRQLSHLHIAAIGPATKKAIEMHGLRVQIVPDQYVAESVVRSLRRRVRGRRVLLVRAKVARDVIPRELRRAGAQVDVLEAYETVVPQASRARLRAAIAKFPRRPDFITFTSSSTVRNFVALLGGDSDSTAYGELLQNASPIFKRGTSKNRQIRGIKLASIGPVTSATLRELSLPVDVEARKYTIPGLIDAIARNVAQSFRR
jgi:uroporphyrinogen-III synthase